MEDKGHFGPGELPTFSREFFEFPQGREEDWLFERFKRRLAESGIPSEADLEDFAKEVKKALDKGETTVDIA